VRPAAWAAALAPDASVSPAAYGAGGRTGAVGARLTKRANNVPALSSSSPSEQVARLRQKREQRPAAGGRPVMSQGRGFVITQEVDAPGDTPRNGHACRVSLGVTRLSRRVRDNLAAGQSRGGAGTAVGLNKRASALAALRVVWRHIYKD